MAFTPMPSTSPLALKVWQLKGFIEVMKKSAFGIMAQRETVMRATELDNARAADNVTLAFTGRLTGVGQTEGGTQIGNEESLDLQSFNMRWNVIRHAVLNPNDETIEQTRTLIKFEDDARKLLPQWHISRLDSSVFNQLAGVNQTAITVDGTVYSGADRQIVQGLNDINPPTSDRITRAGGKANDESLTSSDTFTLDLLDAAIEQLARTYPTVEPLENEEFDLFIAPEQTTDLKRDTSGKIQWYVNELALVEGGKLNGNIANVNHYSSRPVGKYAGVNIYSRFRVSTGENSSTQASIPNVRRAVLCGKNALAFASRFSGALEDIGETDGNVPLIFKTQLKDYDYYKGIEARMIYGVKKLQFDGQDYGSTVISTFAGPHTS